MCHPKKRVNATATDGRRGRVQGRNVPRWYAGLSVHAYTPFASTAVGFFVLILLLAVGCSRGPTYDEALTRYTTERAELDRLTEVSKGIAADMQRVHDEHAAAKRKVGTDSAAVDRLNAMEKEAQDAYGVDLDAMQKKIEAQTVRVTEAEKLKDSLKP